MRILLLTRYDRLGASSRLRALQFVPQLEGEGFRITVQPLLPDAYLQDLYQGKRDIRYAVRAYFNRLRHLQRADAFDLLWVEKELFPWLPFWFESKWHMRLPVVLDFDDAIFHNYDLHNSKTVRKLLGTKIDRLMRCATVVTVGSRYLAQRAERAGAKKVELIPTVVDASRYSVDLRNPSPQCVIGWIGTPRTSAYLYQVADALVLLNKLDGARLVLIGSGPISIGGVPIEIHGWFEDTEQLKIKLFDIGIMPLPDEPWERGKCGYKLIQYMAAGIPVVASPVGANVEIVDHGVNGYLAKNKEEWIHFLSLLVRDPSLRARMGAEGRRKVEQRFCTAIVAPKLRDIFLSIATSAKLN